MKEGKKPQGQVKAQLQWNQGLLVSLQEWTTKRVLLQQLYVCPLSHTLSTNPRRGKEKCTVESCSSDDSKAKYWEQTNKQSNTDFSSESPSFSADEMRVRHRHKRDPKRPFCHLTSQVTEAFYSVKYHTEAIHGKDKKKSYFALRNVVKMQVCVNRIYQEVFVIPFSACLNSIQSLSLTCSRFCCELCNLKWTFPSLRVHLLFLRITHSL